MKVRKALFFLSFGLLFSLALFGQAGAQPTVENQSETGKEKIEFVLFHSDSCPHCIEEIKFIDSKLKPKYSNKVDFKFYEISAPENQDLFSQYAYYYKVQAQGVPMTFIDGEVVHGFGKASNTGKILEDIIKRKIAGTAEPENGTFHLPIIGEFDSKSFSLPLLTLILGFLDGFNPCAMWVLLFLISLLLGMEDKKRMWLLGTVFIFTSGLAYFLFMAAWLNFLIFMGMITAVRVGIGLVASGVGIKNLRDWWVNRKSDGVVCAVSNNKNAKGIFEKIKEITRRGSLLWSLVGIIALGMSVNLVELACSAGFPAVFTQVLAQSDLISWQKYLYMLGYIFFYILDDLIVFILAMVTLKSRMIGLKYAKYSNLVGGALILILGILLIFKPDWLMFS